MAHLTRGAAAHVTSCTLRLRPACHLHYSNLFIIGGHYVTRLTHIYRHSNLFKFAYS